MTFTRPALGIDVALRELAQRRGTAYDPAVVDACVAAFGEGYRFDATVIPPLEATA